MFNPLTWWRDKVKRRKERSEAMLGIVKAPKPPKPKRSLKEIRKSQGQSPASREQKRQHAARMITRRRP